MSANQFTIFSSWNRRPETPEQLGQRMLMNLDALSGLNPYFRNWQLHDLERDPMEMTDENQREYLFPLEEMRGHMTEMAERGVRRDDDGEPDPAGGYCIVASNDEEYPSRDVSLFVNGGGVVDPRAAPSSASFETSDDSPADPSIVTYPVFKAALMSLVSAWDVQCAQAYSAELREFWNQPSRHFLDLAWMTYLSPELSEGFTPPGDVLTEHVGDGGILMIAAQDTFDTANTRHMAAARSILNALSGINAEEEKRTQRLWPRRRTN
jgi:hypothetical protein